MAERSGRSSGRQNRQRNRGRNRRLALALLAGLGAGMLPGAPAMAAEPSAADIQWVQIFLKGKGFSIGGRANGQMTPQTHAALGAWQKSVGLPATGNLDGATISKIMAERTAKTAGTMNNLAQQKIGGGGPGQEPRGPHKEVVPRAAHRAGDVNNAGGGEVALLGPVVRSAPPGVATAPAPHVAPSGGAPSRAAAPAAAGHGTASRDEAAGGPQAAPRASVTATTADGTAVPADGTAVPADVLSKGDTEGGSFPHWLRYAVMAVLAGTLGFIGLGWWRSGRPESAARPDDDAAYARTRREPSFAARRDELTTGGLPRLSGERRGR